MIAALLLMFPGLVGAAAAQTAVAILIPGAGGPTPNDFLMRNQANFQASGVETVVVTSTAAAVSAASQYRAAGRRAVLVGMSRGGLTLADALAAGAPAAGAVFVSTNFKSVRGRLGSPSRLPPTLVVHHRHDACPPTNPAGAANFVPWTRGRARIAWFDMVGREAPNLCGPRGAHAFYMQDQGPVQAIIAFVRSR